MENDESPSVDGRTCATATGRGVVWLRSGASAPAGLLNVLAARGLRVTVVVDAAAAVRELIRGGVTCLVLHEAWRLSRVGELLDTLDRYFPEVRAMHFGQDARVDARLATLGASGLNAIVDTGTEESGEDERNPTKTADAALSSRVTVSEAELAMLLGPVDGEDDETTEGAPR
ncbi:MAG: hypothetical protein AAF328_03745 [Planctomycetota bacterium]